MKHAAESGGLPRRFEVPTGRVRAVRARGAPDRAQVQERFLRELAAAELWLRGEGIPHSLVGSLACWAYAGQAVAPVFGRPEAFGAVQRCPDIDVLVPRAALGAVREYARAARSGPFPVAIDVSGAACFIDLHPDSEQSYLTHRGLRFPVPSDLFAPQPAWLAGTEITTIDPRVLLHTFGTIGGIIRRKDMPKVTALAGALESGTAVSTFSEDDCAAFARYAQERDSSYPQYRALVRLVDEMLEALPPAASSGVRYWLMPAAKRTLARLNG
ncbi:MAG TPA: hypothetical protein VHT26_08880 [Trebonia sp.]|nr:hypothetical protein [Trebonia sp.]